MSVRAQVLQGATGVISAPWLLGYAFTRAMHVSIGVGIIVAYLAGLRIWLAHYGERAEQQDGR
jgi:hypothetical protein